MQEEATRLTMIHKRLREWPNGFPHGVVTRTPTVQELMDVAHTFGFTTKKMLKYSSTDIPCMLEGTYWKRGKQVLKKYTHECDPYAYHRYCDEMDREHTTDNGWLSNVARLFICWMAEELRARGYGNGFSDHFKFETYMRNVRNDAPLVSTTTTSDPPSDETNNWEVALVEYYDNAMDDNVDDLPHTPLSVAETSSFPKPPSQNAQRARTLGTNSRLKEYLRNGASFKRKHGCVNYLTYENRTLYKYVKQYIGTDEGLHLLEACELDYESFSIDHVWPEAHGGPDHLFNYHLMPIKDNSAFRDTPHTHPDKQAYVGTDQMEVLQRLLIDGKNLLPWHDIGY